MRLAFFALTAVVGGGLGFALALQERRSSPSANGQTSSVPWVDAEGGNAAAPAAVDETQLAQASDSSIAPTTLAEALRHPSDLHRSGAAVRYLQRAPFGELAEIYGRYKTSPETVGRLDLMLFVQVWSSRDPADAERHILADPQHPLSAQARSHHGTVLAFNDPQKGISWAEKNLAGRDQEMLVRLATDLSVSAEVKKFTSVEEVLAIADPNARSYATYRYFRQRAERDPVAALGEIAKLPDAQDRDQRTRETIQTWAETDPLAALRWVQEQRTATGNNDVAAHAEHEALKRAWRMDPRGTESFVRDLPAGSMRATLGSMVSRFLLQRDPDQAIAFYEQEKQVSPGVVPAQFIGELFLADPAKGAELYQKELSSTTNPMIVKHLAESALGHYASRDPSAAAEIAARSPEQARSTALYAVAQSWCATDWQAAATWAASLPIGPVKEEALRQFAFVLARHDRGQTDAWLGKLPPDPHGWAATEGFVFSVFDNDPDAALTAVRRIRDPDKATDILRRAWNTWNSKNYRAADDWRTSTTFTPHEREALGLSSADDE